MDSTEFDILISLGFVFFISLPICGLCYCYSKKSEYKPILQISNIQLDKHFARSGKANTTVNINAKRMIYTRPTTPAILNGFNELPKNY